MGNKQDLADKKKDLGDSGFVDEEFKSISLNSNFIDSVYASRDPRIRHSIDKTSGKNGDGILEAFGKLINTIHRFHKERQESERTEQTSVLDGSTAKKRSSNCPACG